MPGIQKHCLRLCEKRVLKMYIPTVLRRFCQTTGSTIFLLPFTHPHSLALTKWVVLLFSSLSDSLALFISFHLNFIGECFSLHILVISDNKIAILSVYLIHKLHAFEQQFWMQKEGGDFDFLLRCWSVSTDPAYWR